MHRSVPPAPELRPGFNDKVLFIEDKNGRMLADRKTEKELDDVLEEIQLRLLS